MSSLMCLCRMALPLICRFVGQLLRCMLATHISSPIHWDLHPQRLEALCCVLRMALKSLDDALRVIANSAKGPADLKRCVHRKDVCRLAQ